MPLTLSGSAKARLEAANLRIMGYRDFVPEKAPRPYTLITEGIALAPTADNPYDKSVPAAKTEMVQLDVVQDLFDPALLAQEPPQTKLKEDPTLVNQIVALFDGCVLEPYGPNNTRVWGCRVFGKSQRIVSRDENTVRDVITLLVERDPV